MGALLELGPEGDVGGGYMDWVFAVYPLQAEEAFDKQECNDFAGVCFFTAANDMVWGELFAVGKE